VASERPLDGEEMLSGVTAGLVALHARYYHRKPVSAKTQMLGDDLLVCVLGGIYTDVEKTMIELQRAPSVRDTRNAFQEAMGQRFIEIVERLSGREVRAFVSDSHIGPDLERAFHPGTAARSHAARHLALAERPSSRARSSPRRYNSLKGICTRSVLAAGIVL
jgi:uncharacterized protein YbcI